jgi:hypothetical protein
VNRDGRHASTSLADLIRDGVAVLNAGGWPTSPRAGDPPRFLLALDDVEPVDDGYRASCPVFGCAGPLVIDRGDDGHWRFDCLDHDHDQVVAYLDCDTRILDDADALAFLAKVVALPPTLAVAEAMLRGEPVPRSRLDPEGLRRYGV